MPPCRREHMAAKHSAGDQELVVTKDDVETILEDLRRQKVAQEIADGA